MEHFPKFPAESGIGYVYFAEREDGLFKIGRCESLEARRKAHRTTDFAFSYAYARETVEYKACEDFLKAHFESKRIRGTRETFSISADDIEEAFPRALKYADALSRGRAGFTETRNGTATSDELPLTEELLAMHDRLRLLFEKIDALECEADMIKLEFALAIGNRAGIPEIVSYRNTNPSRMLVDRKELATVLQTERPDLYERFWQLASQRRFVVL